nr:alpha/beta hydrolase [Hymenobacter lucidus]
MLPGLGADERVFRDLLPLLDGEAHVLSWLLPEPHETLAHYAARLAERIPSEQPCLVAGVSFGGIVALEIGRLRPRARPVLISSVPSAAALPALLRLARATGIYKLIPPQLLNLFPRVGQWYFGVKGGNDYQLFKQILRDTDPTYARWAIDRLLHWNSHGIGPALRIHGTHDRVLPRGSVPVDYLIPGGTHFMILSRAEEIGRILNSLPVTPAL